MCVLLQSKQTLETIVLIIEVFRRLEYPFAVARFGGKQSQRVLKKLYQDFSNVVGQSILESLEFNEGTYPATGFARVAHRVWEHPIPEQEKKYRHRTMLLIVDGLTEEKYAPGYSKVTKDKEVDLVVLNLADASQQLVMSEIRELWDQVASGYAVLDVKKVDELPLLLAGLISNQVKKVLSKASEDPGAGIGNSIPSDDIDVQFPRATVPTSNAILTNVGKLDFSRAKEEGSGGAKPKTMFQVASGVEDIPFINLVGSIPSKGGYLNKVEKGLEWFDEFRRAVSSDPAYGDSASKAKNEWDAAAARVSDQVDDMVQTLEGSLPITSFTRNIAAEKGPCIHQQGMMRGIVTNFHYRKIFAVKKAGGKREYAVALLLDISMSMNGHLAQCALEALLIFVEALLRLDIRNFSVILFGKNIYPIKLPDTPWDEITVASLMSKLCHGGELATLDANALEYTLDLFNVTNPVGDRKCFIFSDGFGSSGIRLAQVLSRARDEKVEILALGVGYDRFFLSQCYNMWVTAVLPCAVPQAVAAFYGQQGASGSISGSSFVDDCVDWSHLAPTAPDARDATDEILRNQKKVFPNLSEQLRVHRDMRLISGNEPTALNVDLCFVIDTTGSMSGWIQRSAARVMVRATSYPEWLVHNSVQCASMLAFLLRLELPCY